MEIHYPHLSLSSQSSDLHSYGITGEMIRRAAKEVLSSNELHNLAFTPIFAWNEAEEGGALLPRLGNGTELDWTFPDSLRGL